MTDENGHTTTYEYDLAGNLDQDHVRARRDVHDADLRRPQSAASVTDERGNTTTYEYDARLRLLRSRHARDRPARPRDRHHLRRQWAPIVGDRRQRPHDQLRLRRPRPPHRDPLPRRHVDARSVRRPRPPHLDDRPDRRRRRSTATTTRASSRRSPTRSQRHPLRLRPRRQPRSSPTPTATRRRTSTTSSSARPSGRCRSASSRRSRTTSSADQTGHTDFRGKTTTMTYDSRDRMLTKVPDPSLGEPSHSYTYSPTGMRLSSTDAQRNDDVHVRPSRPPADEGRRRRHADVHLRRRRQRREHPIVEHERHVGRLRLGRRQPARLGHRQPRRRHDHSRLHADAAALRRLAQPNGVG